jgi:hypothetical protein
LVYPYSLYPGGFSPMRVFILYLVVYLVYGQSNAIFFPLFVVQKVFLLFSAIIPHLKCYPAICRFRYVLRIGLQTLGVNYISGQVFSTFHVRSKE